MSYGDGRPPFGQPPGQPPQYGQPQYPQPQYGQPQQYAPPQYGQPQYPQPQYGQPAQFGQPPAPYGAPPPGYGPAPYAAPMPYGVPYPPPVAMRQQHPRAMAALVLGGLAWFLGLWLILSVPAWIVGAKARAEIRANPQLYTGESEATIGMWLGAVHTVVVGLGVIGGIIAVLVFGVH